MKRHQKINGRHERGNPKKSPNSLKHLPIWCKLLAVMGMAVASGLILLVSLSAYFSDSVSGTVEVKIPQYYFTVTYNSNGGSDVLSAEVKVDTAISKPDPAPTKTGYDFVAWHADPNFSDTAWDFTTNMMPRQNLTLNAKWKVQTYNITYDLGDKGVSNDSRNPNQYTYNIGVAKLENATGEPGYTFDGWYESQSGGTKVTSISAAETGNKTLYARWTPNEYTITYNLNGGGTNHQDNPVKYTYGTGIASFKDATRSGYKFLGWFTAASGGTQVTGISTTTLGNQTLYAQWVIAYTITFRNYDDTATVLDPVVVESGGTLPLPDAPAPNMYFLGWATSKNAAKSAGVYVPGGTYTDIRKSLNSLDRAYLGYPVSGSHEFSNITSNRTFYAVYYKKLKATNGQLQEFIWNNAIWRVMNQNANAVSQRLVMKNELLQLAEVEALGFTQESVTSTGDNPSKEYANNFHFHSQDDLTNTDDERYFFNSDPADTGYGRSRLKAIIDAYYADLELNGDTSAVLKVSLNCPTWSGFTALGVGSGTFSQVSGYNAWLWARINYGIGTEVVFSRDDRFETTLDSNGKKQAFAISLGDIHGAIGLPVASSFQQKIATLTFPRELAYWTRSPGAQQEKATEIAMLGGITSRNVTYSTGIRPALYLSIAD